MRLLKFVNMGGWINWILFGILCFCICQCIERCIYFLMTASHRSKRGFMTRFEKRADEIKNLPPEEQQKEFEKQTTLLYYEMNRGLWFLNFITAVAPSIGLLGTVVGLIDAFQQMSNLGAQVSMQDLAGGIWVAMITTEFGMMISIPGLLFYRTFKRLIEKRMMTIGLFVERTVNNAKAEQAKSQSQSNAENANA